jgi:hypothetical protein
MRALAALEHDLPECGKVQTTARGHGVLKCLPRMTVEDRSAPRCSWSLFQCCWISRRDLSSRPIGGTSNDSHFLKSICIWFDYLTFGEKTWNPKDRFPSGFQSEELP